MDKEQLANKATEVLQPFETGNLMNTLQNLSLSQIFSHPAVLITILIVFFFGVVRKSKTVLLILFSLIALIIMARYTLPPPGEEITFKSLLPFVGGGLVMGAVIIYVSLIKSD